MPRVGLLFAPTKSLSVTHRILARSYSTHALLVPSEIKTKNRVTRTRFLVYVPRVGLEPTRLVQSEDLKSPVSTIPPPRHTALLRSEAELNRCKRFCRPVPNRSAIGPLFRVLSKPIK